MDLRVDDHASVGLGGRVARALRRQDGAGAEATGDEAASRRHGSILLVICLMLLKILTRGWSRPQKWIPQFYCAEGGKIARKSCG
jgi:hypothetical protein